MKEIDNPEEAQRLDAFIRGRTLAAIGFGHAGPDVLTLRFQDGAEVELSTLGGVEVEKLTEAAMTMRRNIDLSRDEAELLDDLLQADRSDRARGIAEDLWRIWGMTPWEQRPPPSPVTDGITWDYEESTTSYYHVFAVSGPLDGAMPAITIDVPQTPENDADVDAIVAALRRIAGRRATP